MYQVMYSHSELTCWTSVPVKADEKMHEKQTKHIFKTSQKDITFTMQQRRIQTHLDNMPKNTLFYFDQRNNGIYLQVQTMVGRRVSAPICYTVNPM